MVRSSALAQRGYIGPGVLLRASGEQHRAWSSVNFTPWSRVQAVHPGSDGILVGLRAGKPVMR